MKFPNVLISAFVLMLACSCVNGSDVSDPECVTCEYARYFDIIEEGRAIVSRSPYDAACDTLKIEERLDNIICMSSSSVAALAQIGADSVISAVSGAGYLTDPSLRTRCDIGYENSLDYEKILSLKPDLLVTYTVSGAEPPYIRKLRELDVPVLVVHDHLENHPLARAEYIRLFGALTGLGHRADSLFFAIRDRYESLSRSSVKDKPVKVLLNIPYSDVWYVPGGESYMTRLIKDAGGEVLGAEAGTSVSGIISLEQAYRLSQEADLWLNPGYCRSRDELRKLHQLFPAFGPLAKDLPIYNNTLRTTPEGGNDFWESGAVRPDLVLEDLIHILCLSEDPTLRIDSTTLKYHLKLE